MFRVFGSAEVLSVERPHHEPVVHKTAHRAVFAFEPREGMIYVRSRAISSRCNDNFDFFGAEEIKQAYRTFVGKPVFVNHHNSDHRQSRGVIIDAALHEDRLPNGAPDTWVEVLMEVDGARYPKLAKALLKDPPDIDRTSMGCDVQISKCSACGNEARNPLEYCKHIPGMKGKRLVVVNPDGSRTAKLIYEECYGLSFFENSLLVEPPADPTAFFLGKVEVGPGLEHLSKAASLRAVIEEKPVPAPTPVARPLQRTAKIKSVSLPPTSPLVQHVASVNMLIARALAEDTLTKEAREPSAADKFFADTPPSADHIVKRFLAATPEEHDAGMNWYSDAHHIAKALGHGDTAKAAGVIGVYSAGTPVAPNYHYASRSLHHNAAVGGKTRNPDVVHDFHGSPNASQAQADQVTRILGGEHHSNVLKSPKVSNYAHLIEHGDDEPGGDKERVVVDRHAVSAAIGRRITDKEFGTLGLSSNAMRKDGTNPHGNDMNPRYERVANAYREATHQLRGMGHDVKAHQVQAVAWTVQKRQNDGEDEAAAAASSTARGRIKGRQKSMDSQRDAWQTHYHDVHGNPHMPENPRLHWGKVVIAGRVFEMRTPYRGEIRKRAYNETKAPQDVDTLRDERCAICGNDIAFDGRECQVCGYIAPPKALGDPDVDKAKAIDSLKQNVDDQLDGVDPSRPGAEFDPGDPENIAAGGDNSANPWLECATCQTALRPAAPQTTGGDPQGSPDNAPAGPAEGGDCPVCGGGPLMSSTTTEDDPEGADLDQDGVPDAEEDENGDGIPDDQEEDPDAEGEDPDEDSDDDPDEDIDADDDDDPDDKKKTRIPASKATTARKNRHHASKESPMGMSATLQALSAQQQLVEHLAAENLKLQRRMAAKDSQIQRLTAGLTVLARNAGVDVETQVRTAMVRKTADEQNPAQPIPEPAPQPPTQTSAEAEQPEAFADVRAPGMVPGSNQDVAADAVTTAYTPGQDIASPPVHNLVDVTAPVQGTQGPRPLSETKTNVDVRVGNPMNPQQAFPLNGEFAQAQRTSSVPSQNDQRFMAALRLARLQLASGVEQGNDDIGVAHKIASNGAYSLERIAHETELLNNVAKAASAQRSVPARGSVPRPAQQVQRIVPNLQSTAAMSMAPGGGGDVDADYESVFLS